MTEFSFVSKDARTGRHTYLVKKSNPAVANAIRRACTELTPVMAIDEIEVHQNSGVLFDEMLALRLGLVVLKTDLKSYNKKSACECNNEGCARCTLQLSLKAKGPGFVYAEALESQDPKVIPVHPKAIVAKLIKGQELEIVAKATLGEGTEHAKYSPGLIWYEYKASVKVNQSHKDWDTVKDKFPALAFKNGKLDAKAIEEHNLFDTVSGIHDEICKVEFDDSQFLFHIEPFGQLSPKEILTTAIGRLADEVKLLGDAIVNA